MTQNSSITKKDRSEAELEAATKQQCAFTQHMVRDMRSTEHSFDGPYFYSGPAHRGMIQDALPDDGKVGVMTMEDYLCLQLPPSTRVSESMVSQLLQDLSERNLHIANGVLHRLVEGRAPPRIRIYRLDQELELIPMVEFKRQGNEKFAKARYQDAIESYQKVIPLLAREMSIGPCDQVELIVTILSNTAECQLRLGMYNVAAQTATDALFLMNHEKSWIRRAKAGLGIAKQSAKDNPGVCGLILLRAQMDLEEIMEPRNNCTQAAKEVCRKLMPEITNELKRSRTRDDMVTGVRSSELDGYISSVQRAGFKRLSW